MKLSKENIKKWKKELDKRMIERTGIRGLSKTITDDEWLADYDGEEPDLAVDDQIDSMRG